MHKSSLEKVVTGDSACSDSLCSTMDRIGVPRESKWRGLILFMRGIKEYDFLNSDQKQKLQSLVVDVLKQKDFSDEKFRQIVRENDRVINGPWHEKLAETLRETASLVKEFQTLLRRRRDDVKELETVTVTTVESGRDISEMLDEIRAGFRDMVSIMERDADNLLELSLTDALTGIKNRRAFDQYILSAVREAGAKGQRLALFMCDIDYFKQFNDDHGHRIGDQALATVGAILKGFADEMKQHENREVFSARYGGEEFVVALPGVSKVEAGELAEIIRTRIEKYNFVIRDPDGQILASGIKIKVSLGVAELLEDCPRPDVAHLVDAADRALYLAKQSGRNRVCLFDREALLAGRAGQA